MHLSGQKTHRINTNRINAIVTGDTKLCSIGKLYYMMTQGGNIGSAQGKTEIDYLILNSARSLSGLSESTGARFITDSL